MNSEWSIYRFIFLRILARRIQQVLADNPKGLRPWHERGADVPVVVLTHAKVRWHLRRELRHYPKQWEQLATWPSDQARSFVYARTPYESEFMQRLLASAR